MRSMNLIPRRRIEARQRRRRLRLWAAALAVYVLALTAVWGVLDAARGQAERVVSGELSRLEEQIGDARRQVALMQPELTEMQLQLQASLAVVQQPDWSVLLALLGEVRGEQIVLKRCVLTPLSGSDDEPAGSGHGRAPMAFGLQLGGLGRNQRAVSEFVLRLEQTGLFDRVKLIETNRAPFGIGRIVAFRLDCSLSERERGPM